MGFTKNVLAPCAIGVALLVPALAAYSTHLSPGLRPTMQFGVAELEGVGIPEAPPGPTLRSFADRSFQRGFERWFDAAYGGRNLLVRFNNEWLYRLFRRSNVSNDRIVVGKDETLFARKAIDTWVRPLGGRRRLENFVAELALLQKEAEARGIPFVFVVTPDKALIYEELLPEQARRFGLNLSWRKLLLRALRSQGLRFVDGHEITARLVRSEGLQAFNPGGIHWNRIAAMHTWNAAIRVLNEQTDRPFSEVRVSDVSLREPRPREGDFRELLNLLDTSYGFLVPGGTFHPTRPELTRRGVLLMNGGSFCREFLELSGSAEIFARIRYFRYARDLLLPPDPKRHRVGDLRATLWETESDRPDAILIENNQAVIFRGLKRFMRALQSRLREIPEVPDRRPGGNVEYQSPRISSSPDR